MAKESKKEKLLVEILARKVKEKIERGYGLLQEKFRMKEEESKKKLNTRSTRFKK